MAEKQMRKAGLWQGAARDRTHWLAHCLLFILLTLSGLQVIKLFISFDDLGTLIDCISVLSFVSMGLLKVVSLWLNVTKWHTLFSKITEMEENSITDLEYEMPQQTGEKQSRDYTNTIQRILRYLPRIYWCAGGVFILSPFAELGLKYFRHLPLEWPHILTIWVPYEDNAYVNVFLILIELFAAVYVIIVHIAFDVSSLAVMIFMSGQFAKLRWNTEMIGGGELSESSVSRDGRAHALIITCHQHYLDLTRLNRHLDSVLNFIMGVYMNVATLNLCATAVQLTNNLSKIEFLKLVQYMFANLTELFLFCLFGHYVLHESDIRPGQGPFGAGWWALAPRTRQELLILATGSSRPLELNAGPFNKLNLVSLLSILQTAYSFYAVLSNY
uniref:Odorant receptor n=1 Tax=Plutella xylostella TaxID=51655 RepID=A0A8G1GN06_PLUXY|nr:odorant receptor 48 [Plutella xylostella]